MGEFRVRESWVDFGMSELLHMKSDPSFPEAIIPVKL